MATRRAQKHRQCGTIQAHVALLEAHPGLRAKRARIQATIDRTVQSGRATQVMQQAITIPVVVHVVYRTPSENISASQVRSQITALNRDYNATNADKSKVPAVWSGLVGNPRLRFALAAKDPQGRPTNGITRTATTETSFGMDDAVKHTSTGGAPAWPASNYLNLWVCTLAGDTLGYAQFPGLPKATDGVVIRNTAFGTNGTAAAPFNLGRTATHEVGHWLNLNHIWGDRNDCGGTDHVADTPNAQFPNYHKPKFPHVSCHNGPNGDMFMNYMDYVDDASMYMFTVGQAARMNATLAGPRSSFLKATNRRARRR